MMVAWQFTAWNVSKKETPVGYGVIGLGKLSITLSGERASRLTQTVPTARIFC